MGFKFKRINFTGRSGEWNNSTSTSRSRAESVVREIAQALLDMNIEWELDTDYNDSITSFCDVPFKNSNGEFMPGLFFKNNLSGNKLFMCYVSASAANGIDLPNSQLAPCGEYTNPSYTGFIVSMIPKEANQSFGHTFDASFLPSSATRIYGTCEANGKTNITSYARFNGNGFTYCWGILATPYCIAMSCGYSNTEDPVSLKLCFACGRVFGNLAHAETTPQAKYGVIQFTNSTGGQNSEAGTLKTLRINYGSTSEDTSCTDPFYVAYSASQGNTQTKSGGCIAKADGSWVGHTDTANIRFYPENYGQLSDYAKSLDSNVRWVPYAVAVISTDLSNDGITSGDGVKGFLDTDLFRCARVQKDQILDNQTFLSFGNNLLVGWDSTNIG